MPVAITGLFEVHLPVSDLERAVSFYRDRLHLALAHMVPERQAAFFWIPSTGSAMLGLWGAGAGPQQMTLHVAFNAAVADVLGAPAQLEREGITPLGFDGLPTREPVVLAWMPAVSVYFKDPDGHMLELLAMLPDRPRSGLSIVSWSAWRAMQG
jgi:lactoylglutathione lyase